MTQSGLQHFQLLQPPLVCPLVGAVGVKTLGGVLVGALGVVARVAGTLVGALCVEALVVGVLVGAFGVEAGMARYENSGTADARHLLRWYCGAKLVPKGLIEVLLFCRGRLVIFA